MLPLVHEPGHWRSQTADRLVGSRQSLPHSQLSGSRSRKEATYSISYGTGLVRMEIDTLCCSGVGTGLRGALWAIAWWNKFSRTPVKRRWSWTELPPALWPLMVTWLGFPPNLEMYCLIHLNAWIWSCKPALKSPSEGLLNSGTVMKPKDDRR